MENMAKFWYCIFTVAVLLGGTAADTACLMERVMYISPLVFVVSSESACRDIDTKFDRTRQELRNCLDFTFDIKKLEDLYQEFCNPNSDFRQKFERQRNCISRNLPVRNCSSITEQVFEDEHMPKMSNYDKCQSVSAEITECLVYNVGRPCGAEGLEVFGRIARETESILTAACFSTYLDKAREKGRTDLMEEIEEAEKKFFETSLLQTDQYETAATTTHSALIWCIVVGLLFAVIW